MEEVEHVGEHDLAWLFYTSGTTGKPKGAMLSHGNLHAQAENYYVDIDDVGPGESLLHAAPMSHGSGLYSIPHVGRGSLQIFPESGVFDADEVVEIASRQPERTIHCFAVPTMISRIVAKARQREAASSSGTLHASMLLAGIKTLAYGGGPMYLEDMRRAMTAFGKGRLVQLYGQAEAPMTITGLSKAAHDDHDHPQWLERLRSVGVARDGVEVRVVTKDGRVAAPGEIGEVTCRGAVVMLGYWRNVGATNAALDTSGWLFTGDLGCMDASGYLVLKDRSKDLIIRGGANIYPREVEEVLLQDSNVLQCSVIGRPDDELGEQVVAYVVPAAMPSSSQEEESLRTRFDALCLQNLARFKRPRAYHFLEELPKNDNGKVLKTALRARSYSRPSRDLAGSL